MTEAWELKARHLTASAGFFDCARCPLALLAQENVKFNHRISVGVRYIRDGIGVIGTIAPGYCIADYCEDKNAVQTANPDDVLRTFIFTPV